MNKLTQAGLCFLPPLIYSFVLELISIITPRFAGGQADASLQVLLCSLICIPLFFYMACRQFPYLTGEAGKRERISPAGIILTCLILAVLGAVFSWMFGRVMTLAGFYERFSNETQEMLLASRPLFLIIGPGLLAPVCEELIYRQLMQQGLKAYLPIPVSIAFAALFFSLGHGNIIQFIYAFPMGLLLGLIREKFSFSSGNEPFFEKALNRPGPAAAQEIAWDIAGAVFFHAGANLFSILMTFIDRV